jgi:hypothetical protein
MYDADLKNLSSKIRNCNKELDKLVNSQKDLEDPKTILSKLNDTKVKLQGLGREEED